MEVQTFAIYFAIMLNPIGADIVRCKPDNALNR